jgi:hypothetical protein
MTCAVPYLGGYIGGGYGQRYVSSAIGGRYNDGGKYVSSAIGGRYYDGGKYVGSALGYRYDDGIK